MTDIENHPDWFGADATTEQPSAGGDDEPPAGDWFDDPTYLDPIPEDAPATTEAAQAEASAAEHGDDDGDPTAERGNDADGEPTGGAEQSAEPAQSAQGNEGSAAAGATRAGRDRRRGGAGDDGTVVRDEQGRPVRQPAASGQRRKSEDSGLIAWLKRLLGLD